MSINAYTSMVVEVTGWNDEGESVEATGTYSIGTPEADAVAEICRFWHIVEIGDTKVYGRR